MISASELLHGVWRTDSEERRANRRAFVEAVLERFSLLPIGLDVARATQKYGQIWRRAVR